MQVDAVYAALSAIGVTCCSLIGVVSVWFCSHQTWKSKERLYQSRLEALDELLRHSARQTVAIERLSDAITKAAEGK